jgi:RHS repeat-associated protein
VGQTQLSYTGNTTQENQASTEPNLVATEHPILLGQRAQAQAFRTVMGKLKSQTTQWWGSPKFRSDPSDLSTALLAGNSNFAALTPSRFDALGRQTQQGTQAYEHDSLGRLISLKNQNSQTQETSPQATYRYNLFGQRIAKTTVQADGKTKQTTYYFYDGSQLVAEADSEGDIEKQYLWLNDKPVAMLKGQGLTAHLFSVHTDHRNAPLALTDESRTVVWQANVADYLHSTPAQGEKLGQIEFNLRGSNQYFDAESGLHYNTQRYFDPIAKRYLTPDPMGLAVGPDLYAFALNKPHSLSDPLGLAPTPHADGSLDGWTYEDKFSEIIKRSVPLLPGEIGAALQELVKPESLAVMAAVFTGFIALQATPFGWIADLGLLGWGAWMMGSGITELLKGMVELHSNTNASICEKDLEGAARALAKRFVTGSGEIVGGISGVWGVKSNGGVERVAKGLNTLIEFGKKRFGGGAPRTPGPPVIEGNAGNTTPVPTLQQGLGGTVTEAESGVVFGKGIQDQGGPFEGYVQGALVKIDPKFQQTPSSYPVIDHILRRTGRVVSTKTMDTVGKYANPKNVYSTLKRYIDKLADFTKDGKPVELDGFVVNSNEVKTREIQLGIPAGTNAEKWAELKKSVEYAKTQGVDLIITVITP